MVKQHRWLTKPEKLLLLEHRYINGCSAKETARRLCCSKRTIQRHCAMFHRGCLFLDIRAETRPRVLQHEHLAALNSAIGIDCTFTLYELRLLINMSFDINVSDCTIWRALRKMSYTHKRVSNIPRQACDVTISLYFAWLRAHLFDNDVLYFVDESGFDHRLQNRDYGWAIRGQRAISRQSTIRGIRYSLIATATRWGLFDYIVLDGTTDGAKFFCYIFFVLFPRLPMNAVLVMDNASIHRTPLFSLVAEFVGLGIIYLPPYSPHLNVAELIFALLKRRISGFRKMIEFTVDNALPILCESMIAERIDYKNAMLRMGYGDCLRW